MGERSWAGERFLLGERFLAGERFWVSKDIFHPGTPHQNLKEFQRKSRQPGKVDVFFHPQTNEKNANFQENVSRTMGCFPWVFAFKPLKITFALLFQLLGVSLRVFICFSNPPQNANLEENDSIQKNDSSSGERLITLRTIHDPRKIHGNRLTSHWNN